MSPMYDGGKSVPGRGSSGYRGPLMGSICCVSNQAHDISTHMPDTALKVLYLLSHFILHVSPVHISK